MESPGLKSANTEEIAVKIARGATFLLAGQIAALAFGFVYRILVARWLGPSDFGVLALLTMLVGIFGLVFMFGVPGAATKYISQFLAQGKTPTTIFSTALKILLPSSLLASLMLLLLSDPLAVRVFHNPAAIPEFKIGSAAVFFAMLGILFNYSIQGFQRMRYSTLITVVDAVVKLVVTVLLLYLGYGLIGAAWGIVAGYLSMAIVGWFLVRKLLRFDLALSLDRDLGKMLLTFGVPLYIALVVELVLGWTDTIVIGYFLGTTEVGYYNVAWSMMMSLNMLVAPLTISLFPAFSEIHAKKDSASLEKVFNHSAKYTTYFLIPCAVGGFLLAELVIKILFGAIFLPGSIALKILVLGSIFLPLRAIGTKFIAGVGRPDIGMRFIMIAAVLNLALNPILVPKFGIAGAAVATSASLAVLTLLCFIYIARNHIKIELNYLPKCALSAAIMGGLVFFILSTGVSDSAKILISVFAGAVLYFSVLYLLGGFDKVDKELARKLGERVMSRFSRRTHPAL
ncbi:MAG: flippase [Chloroflexi bacterium]|nr:flippase [Chloroflexota bacterium]